MYEYRAVVLEVHDGDTVYLDVDQGFDVWHHGMHIRLARINAPELRVDNPAGYESRDFLRNVIPVGTVILLRTLRDKADKYGGRWDGELWAGTWVGDTMPNGVNLNDLMVSSGHAVPFMVGGTA